MKKFFSLIILLHLTSITAQEAIIKGIILDKESQHPIEYANISLLSQKDSLITGVISNEQGKFNIENIPTGKYKLNISFMGYKTVVYQHLILTEGERDFGKILLEPDKNNLKEVVVHAGKPAISYQVDRQVINAASFPEANAALDLLENVPEIKVDVNGAITYRDHLTFSVFINGKPVANGVDRLRQLNAKQIKKIEIITNPSAKYAAQGTGGIINVVLKKTRLKGYNISSNLYYNTKGSYSWGFNISKNSKRGGWHISGNYSRAVYPYSLSKRLDILKPVIRSISEETDFVADNHYNYLSFGYNYDITKHDEVDISFNIDPFKKSDNRHSTGIITENFHNNTSNSYKIKHQNNMTYQYFGPEFSFIHKFDKSDDNKISFNISYSTYLRNFDEIYIDEVTSQNNTTRQGYLYNEQNEQEVNVDLDFEHHFKKWTLEAGSSVATDFIPKNIQKNGYFDSNDNITPFANAYHYQIVKFKRNIYAAYTSLSTQWKKWEIKSGLRLEYTDRIADFTYNFTDDVSQEITQPYNNQFSHLFPSFFLKYSIKENKDINLSYSKRIERPNYYSLMPIRAYDSPYAYNIGNAALQPEYVDSWELKYHASWDKDYFALSGFYHHRTQLISNENFIDSDGLYVNKQINSGHNDYFGSNVAVNYHFFDWWNTNLSLEAYYKLMHIQTNKNTYDQSNYNANISLNQDFTLPRHYKIKLKARYYSPWIAYQSTGNGNFTTQLSIQKSFGKHWKLFISTNNIWGDIDNHSFRKDTDFTLKIKNVRPQYFGFKVSYNFNNRN